MDIISSSEVTVIYDAVTEKLYSISGCHAEIELYKKGFIDFHESGGFTVLTNKHEVRPLNVPEDAYSTLYNQGTRFRLKDGTPMAKPQPCPDSYQLSDLALARLNDECDDTDSRIERAEYKYTRWGSYDGEKIDVWIDPYSGETFSVPHGDSPHKVDRAKLIEYKRQRSWSAAALEKVREQFAKQWFADWMQ